MISNRRIAACALFCGAFVAGVNLTLGTRGVYGLIAGLYMTTGVVWIALAGRRT